MDCKKVGLGVALTTMALSVSATPQTINTMAPDPLALDQGPGYYIWNNESSPSEWRVRWRADDLSAPSIVDWFGSLTFRNANLDHDSVQIISFETGGAYPDLINHNPNDPTSVIDPWDGTQGLKWRAYTNNSGGYDGFDFSLDGYTELLAFSLGSSLFGTSSDDFYQLTGNNSDANAAPAQGIFIGEDYLAPDVLVNTRFGKTYQEFEVLVPEPGTLALLGMGLIGLGAARRRQSA